jgi:hypothetical protein
MAKKMARKKARYMVLVPIRSDTTKKRYMPGDVITEGYFAKAIIQNWLEAKPPVLRKLDDGSND